MQPFEKWSANLKPEWKIYWKDFNRTIILQQSIICFARLNILKPWVFFYIYVVSHPSTWILRENYLLISYLFFLALEHFVTSLLIIRVLPQVLLFQKKRKKNRKRETWRRRKNSDCEACWFLSSVKNKAKK